MRAAFSCAGAALLFLALSQTAFASDLSSNQRGEISSDQPGEISSSQPGEISSSQKGEISSSQKGELNADQPGEISTNKPGVDPALCRALVKHTPDANVAYQPGVDAQGNPVAPADLPDSQQMQLPDKIRFPLTISLVQALHMNTSQFPASALGTGTEATLGTITVEGDKVLFNGKPISDAQQDNLAVLCMQPNK